MEYVKQLRSERVKTCVNGVRAVFPDMLPAGCHVISAVHSPEQFNNKQRGGGHLRTLVMM